MAAPGRTPPPQRYELVERIAVGGMAEVFRARAFGPLGFEKAVAIKRILPDLAADREFVERFVAEARLSVSLTHANIVQILDFSRFGESLYIVMEFVDGADLSRLLKRGRERDRVLPLDAALHIATGLLSGLDYAHRKGVVHRDVSPSNVLVSRAGQVKIADFGIARAAGAGSHTRPFQIMGKWRYMSPEQTRGARLDARSDLFSAGIVLFEVFTGRRLFTGGGPEALAREIRKGVIPAASSVRPELPGGVDELLRELLQRKPERRLGSAAEAVRRLVDLGYGASIPASPARVAEYIEELEVGEGEDAEAGTTSSSGRLIDEIISSELARGGGPAPRARDRITLHDPRPPAAGNDEEEEEGGGGAGIEHADTLSLSFVRAEAGEDGIPRWRVGDATGEVTLLDAELGAPGKDEEGEQRPEVEPTGEVTAEFTAVEERRPEPPELPELPKAREPPEALESPVPEARAGGGRWRWIAAAAGASALIAAGLFFASGGAGDGGGEGDQSAEVSASAEPPQPTPASEGGGRADAAAGGGRESEADAAPPPGVLVVKSDPPGAGVSVDGEARAERTPAEIEVGPGAHGLELTLDGRTPCFLEAVEVGPGERRAVRCDLEPLSARLAVESRPAGAEVWLGGERLGETPLRRELPPSGEQTVILRREGYEEARVEVALRAGERTSVVRQLTERPRLGTIDLYVEPWANVYLGDRKVGVAPRRGLRLPVGRHRLRLKNPVLERQTTIQVRVPRNKPYRVELPP